MARPIPQSPNAFAAIYCRISSDKTGAGLGVERQEADCRQLADRMGLAVKYVLVDNDISAYSGKKRPGYAELLQLIEDQEIDTVISWHTDRLHRRLRDLLDYLDAVEKNQTKTITVKAGDIDLSTSQGIMLAQVSGAIAEGYVRTNTEKLQRAKLQAAEAGEYMGGQRPYGFEPQRAAIRESEAVVIREMAGRVIDGESSNSIAVDLNRRGITTKHGKQWIAANVTNTLTRYINIGVVFHKGVENQAKSLAILTRDEWDAMNAALRLSNINSKRTGRYRRHLLNGLLYCGACGEKLYHKSKQQRDGSYKTTSACGKTDPTTGKWVGCGKVSRMVAPIIDLVTDAVIYRLNSPQLAQQLQRRQSDQPELHALTGRQSALNGRIAQMSDDFYVHGLLDREEFERLKIAANAELQDIVTAIEKSTRSTVLPTMSISGDIQTAWEQATLEWRRDLLFQLIDRVIVHPKPKVKGYVAPMYGSSRFDPDLIEINWKV